MKIYIDESGNTGCVLINKGKLNFETQPLFAIGAVVVENEKQEEELVNKYIYFKKKFGFDIEKKGSDLLTRENNAALVWFIDNILDDLHFKVNLYSKKYYLATLLIRSIMGNVFADEFPEVYHSLASALSLQKNDFFYKYCEFIEKHKKEALGEYLEFLCQYQYEKCNGLENMIVHTASTMLDDGNLELWIDEFMTFGWYENPSIANLINLNALAEFIFMYKFQNNKKNEEIQIIHDNIDEFQDTFINELTPYNIKIVFVNSKENILVQMADNVASIFSHSIKNMVKHFEKKEEWKSENQWDMELVSKVLRRIGIDNVKFTIPIHDWAAAVCVEQMFAPDYPGTCRRNIYFNLMYTEVQKKIIESIVGYAERVRNIEKFEEILSS